MESNMSKVCISNRKFYNRGSAFYLGWDPTWFELPKDEFGDKLTRKIIAFQEEYNIAPDGIVGEGTFTRLSTSREAVVVEQERNISCQLHELPINWPRVSNRLYNKLPSRNYREVPLDENRNIDKIVIHWDAALSSQSAFKILKKRGYSTHFLIDNDGSILQLINTNHVGYHCKEVNNTSIGIDISNAYYPKYQDTYEANGHGTRPTISTVVNGQSLKNHLGYYPEQVDATRELVRVLTDHYDIPLTTPDTHNTLPNPDDESAHSGIFHHYHFNENKIDTAGFPIKLIIKDIKRDRKDNEEDTK